MRMLMKVAGAAVALFTLSKLAGAKEPPAPIPDIREPIVESPIVVLPPAEPPTANHICYRGFKIYPPNTTPSTEEIVMSNPELFTTSYKFYTSHVGWVRRGTEMEIKQLVDEYIAYGWTVAQCPDEPPRTCYRGYKIYAPPNVPDIPQWADQPTYKEYHVVFWDNPIFNVTGDKPFWFATLTLEQLKDGIDRRILSETPYKSNPEGTQC